MDEQLRKRIEEAAEKYINNHSNYLCSAFLQDRLKEAHIAGAEHGYKEAIEVAKEWLKENTYNKIIKGDLPDDTEEPDCCTLYSTQQQLLADFELYMNKLWEK